MTTVREATYSVLRKLGITKIFGNPGSTELAMFRDFPKDFDYILGLQETSVVSMADGYALATRNAALVNLHSAAGLGHAMGAVFTAFRNQAPIVIIAGQQARSMLPFEPYLSSERATELPRPYVKWSIEPARAEDVPAAIARAYYVAMQEPRGPTFVSVPVDDWDCACESVDARIVSQRVLPDPVLVGEAAEAMAQARKPVIIVGQELAQAGVWEDLVSLAERHQAPVYSAPHASRNCFPEDHPLFAGFLLWHRQAIVEALAGHDLILVLGAPVFTYHVEGSGPFVPDGARLIQIVSDPSTATWTPVGTSIVGNLRHAVQALCTGPAPSPRSAPPPMIREFELSSGELTDAFLMQRIERHRPPTSIIINEAPTSLDAMRAFIPMTKPDTYFTFASGSLGYGMPAAVGIAMGVPDRKVIAIIGDGSSNYAIQALWTAAQRGVPVAFIVLNNHGYAALVGLAQRMGIAKDDVVGAEVTGIDFCHLARGYGVPACRVEKANALDEALQTAFAAAGPVLVEVIVN
ncbi:MULTISPECIES: benzoylformate decarboxylase [unclassified Burkholderia]|uniref:benzoylformate decarboxylase n=1 Tax=unclassified Burkholderia TaxID=2613784 RepID=UPI002AB18CC1|nr:MULTISPECIES: benzoylformate decarboxylase [unclassified Burkholderia]